MKVLDDKKTMHTLSSFTLFVLIVSNLFFGPVAADINFRHCDGPIDLGGHEKEGNIHNACVKDHHFQGEHHAWVIRNTLIKNTNFTSCTFRNIGRTMQSFWGTVWERVIFKDSTFASAIAGPTSSSSKSSFIPESLALFQNVSFRNVQFINCTFEKGVDIVFLQFVFRQVSFQQCRFLGTFFALRGLVQDVIVEKSIFGDAYLNRTNNSSASDDSSRYKGDMHFSHVEISDFGFMENDGTNNTLSFGSAMVRDAQLSLSSLGSFQCEVSWDEIAQLDIPYTCDASPSKTTQCDETIHTTEMNDTSIGNVTFYDGVYCQRITGKYVSVRNVKIRNMIDLSKSRMTDLVLDDIVGDEPFRKTNILLNDSTIAREKLSNLLTTNVTLTDATFTDAMLFSNVSISDKRVDVMNALFVQERIGGECCSIVCETRGCVCAIEYKPIWCPQANVTTRSTNQGSCFPADALLRTKDESGKVVETRMDAVRLGMEAVGNTENMDEDSQVGSFGQIFFFGHKDAHGEDIFVRLTVSVYDSTTIGKGAQRIVETTSVQLSKEHLIGVIGRGYVTAGSVNVGEQVMTIWGRGRVTNVAYEWGRGLYAPVTTTGDMIVNGVLVSCFTEHVDYVTATALLLPLRWAFVIVGRKIGEWVLSHATWFHEKSAVYLLQW